MTGVPGHQSADISAAGETGALGGGQERDVLDLVPTSIDLVHALPLLARAPGGRCPSFVHGHLANERSRSADGPQEGMETGRVSVSRMRLRVGRTGAHALAS